MEIFKGPDGGFPPKFPILFAQHLYILIIPHYDKSVLTFPPPILKILCMSFVLFYNCVEIMWDIFSLIASPRL